jgi:hypothetical protein
MGDGAGGRIIGEADYVRARLPPLIPIPRTYGANPTTSHKVYTETRPECASMKVTYIAIAAAVISAATISIAPANACGNACRDASHHKHHANKVHYSGKHGVGYYRRGPRSGYGFGFSSYKGDPFGADDYFDGYKCHYVHHRDYCDHRQEFTGFRWFPPNR